METIQRNYILEKKFSVTSADADFDGKLKMSALTNFFIQSAIQHADELGWGASMLAEQNLAWVLSSVKIEINSYPEWCSSVNCITWPKGINRIHHLRDFQLLDSNGQLIANATSNWLLINLESRRPKVLESDNELLNANSDKHAIKGGTGTVSFDGEIDHIAFNEVKYSDIDFNKHLTATRYIDYIFDTYTLESLNSNRPKSMTIHYLKEASFGDKLKMLRGIPSEDSSCFQLESAKDGIVLFKGLLEF